MAQFKKETMDGNTAAAHVAYAFSEVAAIYPITPSTSMGELTDAWSANGKKNVFGTTVDVAELQSEGGAAGAVHGALSAGALTTTFTASQGLLLMLPNMHKIAGEMLPTNFWVTARSLAAQSLSIFGDHADIMSARNTGFAIVACNSIQEVMDIGIASHLATLKSSVPFLTFLDGFRTSHEIQKIEVIDYETIASLVETKYIERFRANALNPERPRVKTGAQNPDVYFQGRETTNKHYAEAPGIMEDYLKKVSKVVGRDYNLFDYVGAKDADSIIIAMGSGCETIEEAVEYLNKQGKKYGLVKVRLFRPFSVDHFINAIPKTVTKIAVLDRTKEPGSVGEPLFLDVATALRGRNIFMIGGRYGLSSKEFNPGMVKSVFDHLDKKGFHGFTVGINDDVTHLSLPLNNVIHAIPADTISCKFWGLGSDGTVGANKNSIKIIGDNTDLNAQGYFQYDSKKSGGITRSHLRFGESKIRAQYLVDTPDFVACHNPAFIGRYDVLEGIKEGGTFLLNSSFSNAEVFANLTEAMQKTIIEKKISFYNIDALEIANSVGLGGRINTVMQAAFFIISKVLPKAKAISLIKEAIKKSYIKNGEKVVNMNILAVDKVDEALVEIAVPKAMIADHIKNKKLIPDNADAFTRNIIEPIMREQGDTIPVSHMPFDGYIPSGTAALEKRGVAPFVPHWDSTKCIQCNRCSMICPHAAIRAKLIPVAELNNAPETFVTLDEMMEKRQGDVKHKYKIQVYIDDCQGCGACILECPGKALTMSPIEDERAIGEQTNYEYFESLPTDILGDYKVDSVKGSQFKQPLLEFSGACAGCGETPYVKLLTQLVGDRMMIANATGCSSIWAGSFPTIPYTKNKDGHGPAWANSLFEDNAEYAYGYRLAVNANRKQLKYNVEKLLPTLKDKDLIANVNYALENWESVDEAAKDNVSALRKHLPALLEKATKETKPMIQKIIELQSYFLQKSVWGIGGDGWAYDIDYGGLDHVLAQNKNMNILVLDTEVYSNTGGQASKATPLGSVAKFAESGKTTNKKDLGKMFMSYGYIYVAQISMGHSRDQAIKAIKEAEAYDGPSIVIAYAPCINHGINMAEAQKIEKKAVDSGYWLTYRFNPALKAEGKNPLQLDCKKPTIDPVEFVENERRYNSLSRTFPDKVDAFREGLTKWVNERYESYVKMAEDK